MKQAIIGKTLAVAVILLFIGVGINPAIATVEPEVIQLSILNPDETRYLANFTMDIGENITNDNIEYKKGKDRKEGNWTINVKINFNCPDNFKFVIKYEYFAEAYDSETQDEIADFFDVKDTVTIINGSNPSNIDIDYTEYVFSYPSFWSRDTVLSFRLKANLKAYEYIDGEWIENHTDNTLIEFRDFIVFNRIRPSEGTRTSDDDCNLCPKKVSKSHLVLIRSLLNRLDRYDNELFVLSQQYPEIADLYIELSDSISTLKEMNTDIKPNSPDLDLPIICGILYNIINGFGNLSLKFEELYFKYSKPLRPIRAIIFGIIADLFMIPYWGIAVIGTLLLGCWEYY